MKLDPTSILEPLSQDQLARLREFERLLADRGADLGVVSRGDTPRLWDRHIVDSLRALPCLTGERALADLGSGGGLPGIPLAIAMPGTHVTLIEGRGRRAAFLELVAERLDLPNVAVLATKIERAGLTVDLCTARALAPPNPSWALAEAVLTPRGRLVYWAGRRWSPAPLPAGIAMQICADPVFPWQGPVVIMRRLEPEAGPGSDSR